MFFIFCGIIKKLRQKMTWTGFLCLGNFVYIKLAVFAFLQITSLSLAPPIQVSTLLSVLCILFLMFLPFKVRSTIRKIDTKDNEKWGEILLVYKTPNHAANFEAFNLLRKLLFSMCLVFIEDSALIQIISLIVLQSAYCIILTTNKPYE